MTDKNAPAQILDMDATAVLAAYRAGTLTPSEAVEVCIAQQQRANPQLNAITDERYAAARAEAAKCDALLAAGKMDGALFGVPMSIKEAFDVPGLRSTGGLRRNKDNVVQTQAPTAAKLREAGAIILNKTNTPELCFCQETDNLLFGRSNNPWNLERTTGGSSGGEAALLAVGGAAAGYGSDIGGSIRIPSHFNGVVGFKPGAHRFLFGGHYPYYGTPNQDNMLGYGPIVKSVRDAALLYSVAFPEFAPPTDWSLPAELKVVTYGSFHKTVCSPETTATLEKAQQALAAHGATLDRDAPPYAKDAPVIWQMVMSEDRAKRYMEVAYPGRSLAYIIYDNLRARLGLPSVNHWWLSWAFVGTNLFPPNEKQSRWVLAEIARDKQAIDDLLGDSGVFVTPAYPTPAKKHGEVYAEIMHIAKTFRWVLPFITLANAFGLPAIVVPCGRSADGLPIGLQVAGRVGREQLVFRVAKFLEEQFGGWQRCTSYD